MIKIISGWSEAGGSTVAHINLCNALNENGLECKFYGPHTWHLDKCNSDLIQNLTINKEDIIIAHFINLPKLNCKKMIYSCHESSLDPLSNRDLSMYSKVHYVSRWQQKFHNIPKSYFILPNVLDDLKMNEKHKEKIGGIIGSVDYNKQTHISIKQALEDGCEKVYLFGKITDQPYFQNYVQDLISDKVILYGYSDNKQAMYDMITDVYQNSIRETWGYVAGECQITGTKYHSNGMCNFEFMEKIDIVNSWKKVLGV